MSQRQTESVNMGYIFMPFDRRSVDAQREEISRYCHRNHIDIHDWIQIDARTHKISTQLISDVLLNSLKSGDTLMVADLSRLGRSVGQIAVLVDTLHNHNIKLISVREGFDWSRENDPETIFIRRFFALLADIERRLLSERALDGLKRAVARGKKLGRPKGAFSRSKLDGKEKEIRRYLSLGVNKTNIARIYQVSWSTLNHFIQSRRIAA